MDCPHIYKKETSKIGRLVYIICVYISYPENANFDELWDEVATKVESNEGFEPADAGSANEDGGGKIPRRDEGIVGRWSREGTELMVIEFDDSGVNSDGEQQLFHDVTHATRRPAEDDERVLRYQPPDPNLRRLLLVYGKAAAAACGGATHSGG